MLYDLMDIAIAEQLGVSVEEYIKKIEMVDEDLMSEIIFGLLEGDEEKAKDLFNRI